MLTITRNLKDYQNSEIAVMTPHHFLKMKKNENQPHFTAKKMTTNFICRGCFDGYFMAKTIPY